MSYALLPKKMSEATSKGGLSRFSVSRSSKQTDRKLLINNDQGVLFNQKNKLLNKAIPAKAGSFLKTENMYFVSKHFIRVIMLNFISTLVKNSIILFCQRCKS